MISFGPSWCFVHLIKHKYCVNEYFWRKYTYIYHFEAKSLTVYGQNALGLWYKHCIASRKLLFCFNVDIHCKYYMVLNKMIYLCFSSAYEYDIVKLSLQTIIFVLARVQHFEMVLLFKKNEINRTFKPTRKKEKKWKILRTKCLDGQLCLSRYQTSNTQFPL